MPDEPVKVGALEVGGRYRVDWKHEGLRRSFRFVGTLASIEDAPGDAPGQVLTFEVRPRFGSPALQRVDAATLLAVERLPEPG
jgi:hypothetical protein